MWWHTRRNQISSFGETDESFKSAGASVQSTTGSRSVCIIGSNGSNAGYTMFRGSVKSTGYPLLSPVSPSLPHPFVAMCHHISTGLYWAIRTLGTAAYGEILTKTEDQKTPWALKEQVWNPEPWLRTWLWCIMQLLTPQNSPPVLDRKKPAG